MMKVKKDMKTAKKKLEEQKENVFNEWKNTWPSDKDKEFYDMFLCNYEYLKQKISYNRSRNFIYKGLYLAVLGFFLLSYIAMCIYNIFIDNGNILIFIESSVFLFIGITVCTLISKVLDIRKFQETWARHSQHKFKLDMEMLLFICRQKPYHTEKREDEFEKNVFEVWKKNHGKFVKNMETKEVSIMEGTMAAFDYMIPQKDK